MTKFLGKFQVLPYLPKNLEKLRDLAYNLHWTWNAITQSLFRRLDSNLWEKTHHNPLMMLGKISQEKLEQASNDDGFI
ncbi:MAG: DUF3417 domain-containing protein, partial [Bacteroidetes bacterium]